MKQIPLFLVYLLFSIPALANPQELTTFKNKMAIMNSSEFSSPAQMVSIDQVVGSPITDPNNNTFGTVEDLMINPEGNVSTIAADIEAAGISDKMMFFSMREVSPNNGSGVYQLSYARDNMGELLPQFLANIETAAGGTTSLTSARTLKNREVLTPEGERLAQVKEVYMDKEGRKVKALLLANILGAGSGKTLTVPYGQGMALRNTGFENDIIFEEDYVAAIKSYSYH